MNLAEAYKTLDLDNHASELDLKANFRWLVKFYHPDNPHTHDTTEFKKIIIAFNTIKDSRQWN